MLAKEKHGLRGRDVRQLHATFIPFTAQTCMSGVNLDGRRIRKGSVDAVAAHVTQDGGKRSEKVMREADRIAPPGVWTQIEVENLDQLRTAIAAGAKMILLDNMSVEQMQGAVSMAAGRAELEASGGITLANVRAVAETGVDRISIGSLTKDIKAVDLSMRFE